MNILEDIVKYRGNITVGGNPIRFVELVGGKEVPLLSHQPDPITFREKYYYNTRLNALFLKVETLVPPVGSPQPPPPPQEAPPPSLYHIVYKYWKKVSEY